MPDPVGRKTRELRTEHTANGEEITLPLGTVLGARDGPTVAITSGMHAGECQGVYAAVRLFRELDPAHVAGTVLVVPVISTRAFFMRSMQLSPVDEKEMHYQVPGNPRGTYSEQQIDLLYRLMRGAEYVIDMHAGELVQELTPWVAVPVTGDPALDRRSSLLARAFEVPFLDFRADRALVPAFAAFLADHGIANVWTEIGRNGLPEPETIRLQYEGCLNALRWLGMVPGEPVRHRHRYLQQRHHTVVSERSGVWWPAVRAGQTVREGDCLGTLSDLFGEPLEEYRAPFDGVVLYVWTNPAINAERRPHGYNWHSGLVRLAGPLADEPNVAL